MPKFLAVSILRFGGMRFLSLLLSAVVLAGIAATHASGWIVGVTACAPFILGLVWIQSIKRIYTVGELASSEQIADLLLTAAGVLAIVLFFASVSMRDIEPNLMFVETVSEVFAIAYPALLFGCTWRAADAFASREKLLRQIPSQSTYFVFLAFLIVPVGAILFGKRFQSVASQAETLGHLHFSAD